MSKLGFVFYPKDWWTSDTFFELDAEERYIYLECIFLMYQNNGYLSITRETIEARLRTQIKPKLWEKITQKFLGSELGYTHSSVKNRSKRAVTSKANGKLGGRPPKINKPNNLEINLPSLKLKEKKRKETKTILTFDKFYDLYDLKKGRKQAELSYKKVNETDRSRIIDTLEAFKKSIKDFKFMPNPSTYLNQERWNDELNNSSKPKIKPLITSYPVNKR